MLDLYLDLQKWYLSQCDGDWEHGNHIHIDTLDNPGWSVSINLQGTELEEVAFERISSEISDTNWIVCWVENHRFEGRCGPLNLNQVIEVFLQWKETNNKRI